MKLVDGELETLTYGCCFAYGVSSGGSKTRRPLTDHRPRIGGGAKERRWLTCRRTVGTCLGYVYLRSADNVHIPMLYALLLQDDGQRG